MRKIVMNEWDYLSELRERGNLGNNVSYATGLLAKYYRSQGDNIDEIKDKLKADLRKYEPYMNQRLADHYITNALKHVDKRKLNNVNEILVTQAEIDKIMSVVSYDSNISDGNLQRLAFTLLCFAKFELAKGKNEPWINCDLKYVYKAAKLSGYSRTQCNMCMHQLYKNGFIQLNERVDDLSIKVPFADKENIGNVALKVGDINYAGDYFLQYMGRKYVECQSCGKLTPKTGRRTQYCHDCATALNREKTRQRMAELRKKC